MRVRLGPQVAIVFGLALAACSPSSEKIAADKLQETVAASRSSAETEAESDRLAGKYALTPIANEGGRWCDLLLDPGDGDDFIGFQGIWFGPGCEQNFPMLAHVKGWGPTDAGITLYGVNKDTLEQKEIKFARIASEDFRGLFDNSQYRLRKLWDQWPPPKTN